MSEPISRLRLALVTLGVLPLLILANVVVSITVAQLAEPPPLTSESLTPEVFRDFARDNLLIVASLNALILIPGGLLLARLGGKIPWTSIGFHRQGLVRLTGIGFLLGMLLLLLPAGLGLVLGEFTLSRTGTGVPISGVAALPAIFGLMPGLLAAAFAEELLLRGFLLRLWLPRIGRFPALFLTSSLFALLHSGNPDASSLGTLGAFIAGYWLGLAFLESKRRLCVRI